MFDLNDLSMKDTFEVHLRNPATDELLYFKDDVMKPCTITMYSKASKVYRKAVTEYQNRLLKQGRNAKQTAEKLREDSLELALVQTVAVNNIPFGDKELTLADLRSVYADPKFIWIREQIEEASEDVSNFLGK
jgi:hypothetical protein